MKVILGMLLMLASFCMYAQENNKEIKLNPSTDLNSKPMIIMDSVRLSPDFDLATLKSENIASINVIKNIDKLKLYGEAGKNGVIIITSRKSSIRKHQ
ncbi:MAG: hypothetical protein HOP08_11420 [Cyclobacteriaceae bacterium]|nr:hypothetical protein [Cyclobacteriaceae bacterium]